MKAQISTLAVCVMLLLQSCCSTSNKIQIRGSGNIVNKEISVSDYKDIHISAPVEIVYQQKTDDTAYFELSTDDNILPFIEVKVKKEKLVISMSPNYVIAGPSKIIIRTNSTNLRNISVHGSGNVYLKEKIEIQDLDINIYGSAYLRSDQIRCKTSSFTIKGSASMQLAGESESTSFSVSGSAHIKAIDFLVKKFTANISGSSDITISAQESIYGNVSGSASIRYKGNPTDINLKQSGSGSIRKITE